MKHLQIHLERLLDIARKQNSHRLLVEVHVLQSKLALLQSDFENARLLLTQAQVTAEARGLRRLAMIISSEHDALLDDLPKWEEDEEQDHSLVQRLEHAQINKQIERMLHPGLVQPPELSDDKPIMLLILDQAGLTVYSETFVATPEVNEYLMGGFLSAIQTFTTECFAQTLDRIRLEEYTLLIKSIPPFTLCYVFKGQSYTAQERVTKFIEELSKKQELVDTISKTVDKAQVLSDSVRSELQELLSGIFTH